MDQKEVPGMLAHLVFKVVLKFRDCNKNLDAFMSATTGIQGLRGLAGRIGPIGKPGAQGERGIPGSDGKAGEIGPQGIVKK